MVLKLAGLGFRGYCSDRFNVFDGVIVILSTIEVILFYSGVSGSGGSAISAFRAFRLLRVLKLAKSWTSIRNLMNTAANCFRDVSYFSILLLICMFIYTLIGMELFAYRLQFDRDH
jgi:hypothetical protein